MRLRSRVALRRLTAAAVGCTPGEACPGPARRPCPYAAVQIIGQRAEGVLRFPEAVRCRTRRATCTSPTS